MGAKTCAFILVSFAFSFVLTSPENAIPSNNFNDKNVVDSASVSNNADNVEIINQLDGTTTQKTVHDMEKRAVMLTPEHSYGEMLVGDNSKTLQDDDDREKRSKMGFTGMRGKKGCSEEAMENCGQITGSDDESGLDTTKRALRGFGGWMGGKRAPLSFHGMRGKKADEYGNEIAGPGVFNYKATMPTEEFLINSGLLDEGGLKPELDLPELTGQKPEEEILDEELFNKRSPYSFQGMRGKKNNFDNYKRAMGFLGMRGKKETQFWYPYGFYKRVPQSSFFGMKGKKAQFNGFFGMRGKKASSSPLLDLQDKQEPLIYDMGDMNLDGWKESEPSNNRFRRGTNWWNNSKKAKNAFFGIRGKKMVEESVRNRFPASFE